MVPVVFVGIWLLWRLMPPLDAGDGPGSLGILWIVLWIFYFCGIVGYLLILAVCIWITGGISRRPWQSRGMAFLGGLGGISAVLIAFVVLGVIEAWLK